MRWLVFLLAGLLPYTVEAAQVSLVPINTPLPPFPEQLLAARHAGKARVLLTVRSDGVVAKVKAIESSHPDFTSAVEQTLVRWLFKPWIGTHGAPALMNVTLPVIFGSQGLARFDSQVSVGLGNIPCAYFNYEIDAHRKNFAQAPVKKVDSFWYTGQFLHGSYAAQHYNEEQRRSLLRQLEQAIPAIIEGCRNNPQRHYGDYLPVPIKAMLIGVAEPREAM